jgi:hypothetical protein
MEALDPIPLDRGVEFRNWQSPLCRSLRPNPKRGTYVPNQGRRTISKTSVTAIRFVSDWTGNQGTGTSAYRAYSRAHETISSIPLDDAGIAVGGARP